MFLWWFFSNILSSFSRYLTFRAQVPWAKKHVIKGRKSDLKEHFPQNQSEKIVYQTPYLTYARDPQPFSLPSHKKTEVSTEVITAEPDKLSHTAETQISPEPLKMIPKWVQKTVKNFTNDPGNVVLSIFETAQVSLNITPFRKSKGAAFFHVVAPASASSPNVLKEIQTKSWDESAHLFAVLMFQNKSLPSKNQLL